MERCWRTLECPDEWGPIVSFDTEPEAGVVAQIGMGLMALKANQGDRYVVGAGHVA